MLSRRSFVAVASAAVASAALVACGSKRAGPDPVPAADDVARFVAFSAILTGFDDLDASNASLYLGAIRATKEQSALMDAAFAKGGFGTQNQAKSLDDLERAGIFADPDTLALTNDVLQMWYSGTYVSAGKLVVATWASALAWRACTFTKPPSYCGASDYWASVPVA